MKPLPIELELTEREARAVTAALARALAGEPETDDEDLPAMRRAQRKIVEALELTCR